MGIVTSVLLGAHEESTYDKSGILTAVLFSGELFSVTEAQMFSGSNWFAYGVDGRWEIIAALNCVLQVDGSYVVSDFLRGQKGTEWTTGLHQIGDYLILLDATLLDFIASNTSALSVSHLYRGITDGFSIDSDADRSWTYQGINLKPLAPCHLTGQRTALTNDWVISWVRNSRFGNWLNYVDMQIGEQIEAYEIEVFDSSYSTLKRTLSASTAEITYTAAQQTTDFSAVQSILYLKIYQLSATVGRGYPLVASIQREGGLTYTRDWNDNLIANQTLFGAAGAAHSASSGKFNLLTSSISTDAKSRFDDVPSITDFDLTVDVVVNTAVSQVGICFRGSYWSNTNDTFAYAVYLRDTYIDFGKGSNSAIGSWTSLSLVSQSFSLGVTYKLRVRMTGNRVNVWVDDVLLIDKTDNTYTSGQIALRAYAATTAVQYDNLTILY